MNNIIIIYKFEIGLLIYLYYKERIIERYLKKRR